ncbi:thiopurine S-methyltransferase [Thalassotalea sp. LPB0316]|uniref:thiopurine S-methyltransferase n=1 Tax=Thalassotalea sp. LPB0316 TaxID=2769490 RepID=UPI001867F1A5|nr:thiopurine S-methyltransferase [Thalassotalea sp. LPB0316]QOL24640.1 thiopurine S-methyltransferase [Thalassotalea sp. LPB0316]
MEASFWHNCWQKDSIGFHQDELHPFLTQYIQPLIGAQDHKVFVPLCGKSLDMFFWAEHMQVDGCELSEIACRDFFEDHNIDYQTHLKPPFVCYSKDEIRLYQGDIFELSPEMLGKVDWVYDRAALIALPKSLQLQYVDYIRSLVTTGVKLALITLEFPPEELSGPPFPVFQADVNHLFDGFNIELIGERELTNKQFARRTFDVSFLREKLYLITV